LRPVIDEIRRQIADGRGFVVVRRLPVEDYSKDEIGMIFWGIGTHLGRGLSQSVLGDRLSLGFAWLVSRSITSRSPRRRQR
jgi:hypothetical protein